MGGGGRGRRGPAGSGDGRRCEVGGGRARRRAVRRRSRRPLQPSRPAPQLQSVITARLRATCSAALTGAAAGAAPRSERGSDRTRRRSARRDGSVPAAPGGAHRTPRCAALRPAVRKAPWEGRSRCGTREVSAPPRAGSAMEMAAESGTGAAERRELSPRSQQQLQVGAGRWGRLGSARFGSVRFGSPLTTASPRSPLRSAPRRPPPRPPRPRRRPRAAPRSSACC